MRRAVAVTVSLATLTLAACSSSDSDAAAPSTTAAAATATTAADPTTTSTIGPGSDPSSTTTAPLAPDPVVEPGTGPAGDVLRTEPLEIAAGVRSWRVWYRSVDVAGNPAVTTGIVVAPATVPAGTTLPVVAFGHPTTGLADACAPSLALAGRSPTPDQASVLLIRALAPLAASRNWVLTMSDYEGLGTPGVHPFLVADSAGRSVLDSVRAAARLEGTGATAGSPVVLWGYSQGGGAAISAAELAPAYAPELRLVGVAAGAPASELALLAGDILATTDGDRRAYLFLTAAGFAAARPDLDLDAIFTDAGLDLVQRATVECASAFGRVVRAAGPTNELVEVDPTTVPAFAAALEENTPGRRPVGVPVFIAQGDADTLVVPAATERLQARLCAQGARQVDRQVYPGGSHGSTAILSLTDTTTWVADRLAGTPAPSDC